jgi:hypothetical protein
MSPTALDAPGHHDSFSLPRGGGEQVKVHSSAKRSPEGGLITVESDDVVYDESEIRAKYTDRGAHVTSEFGFGYSQPPFCSPPPSFSQCVYPRIFFSPDGLGPSPITHLSDWTTPFAQHPSLSYPHSLAVPLSISVPSPVIIPLPYHTRLTVSEDADGKLHVKKTEKHYEFLTKSKVGKVG